MEHARGGDLLGRDQPPRDEQLFEPFDPDFIIARRQIVGWVQRFARVPGHVDIPFAQSAGRDRESERALFPIGVEDFPLRFASDGAETHHSAKILGAVHAAGPPANDVGSVASPAPTIESRLTSAASRSSLQPSVPAGRKGTTR